MNRTNYLARLDETLSAGAARLPKAFVERQIGYVLSRQCPDGGFASRSGRSDLYYTRFGLEALSVLGLCAADAAWSRARESVRKARPGFADLVSALSFLHCTVLLEQRGAPPFEEAARRSRLGAVVDLLGRCRNADGGFAVAPEGPPGPYHAFLAALCYGVMGAEMPDGGAAVGAVVACGTPDGGFAETPGRPRGQTNPTAAAVAFLGMAGALDDCAARRAAEFLVGSQSPDGGWPPHGGAGASDLLSTFTALVALASLERLGGAKLARAGRFVRSLAPASGGFKAAAADTEPDVEYSYYGASSLALLAQAARL